MLWAGKQELSVPTPRLLSKIVLMNMAVLVMKVNSLGVFMLILLVLVSST